LNEGGSLLPNSSTVSNLMSPVNKPQSLLEEKVKDESSIILDESPHSDKF